MKNSIVILVLILFVSCSDEIEEGVQGSWIIEKMQFQDKDLTKCRMLTNTIDIEDGEIEFPEIYQPCDTFPHDGQYKYKYQLEIGDQVYLQINGKKGIFTEKFRLYFVFDKDEHFRMILKSENWKIQCVLHEFARFQGDKEAMIRMQNRTHRD